jgi:hypothetical protein
MAQNRKKQEYVARSRGLRGKTGSGNSSTFSVNSGSGPDYQTIYRLDEVVIVSYRNLT